MESEALRAQELRVELHRPSLAELRERQRWLLDPQMMAYNAGWDIPHPGYDNSTGCIREPSTQWPRFLARHGDPSRAGYFYLRDRSSGDFVGHVHYRTSNPQEAEIGVNVVPARRRQGLGREGLQLLLERVWRETRASLACNTFDDERTAAVRLHAAMGFEPGQVSSAAGRAVRHWHLRRPDGWE